MGLLGPKMTDPNSAWCPLDEINSPFLAQSRLDYAHFMEKLGTPPPVAFADKWTLLDWMETVGLSEVVPFKNGENAVRVRGKIRGVYIEQVWVKATYSKYREPLKELAKNAYQIHDISGVDADHVIARTILNKVPNSWIAIFPVYASSNRGFGRIEAKLPKLSMGAGRALLNPLGAFKIFNGRMPKNKDEFHQAMCDVKGQFQSDTKFMADFLCGMEDQMLAYF